MATLWGLCMALSVLFSDRVARAQSTPAESSIEPAPQSRFESAFTALSTSLSATLGLGADRAQSEVEPEPAPLPPSWLAGLCDARGASAIAPLPLISSRDGVVKADDSCQGQTLQAGVSFERHEVPQQMAPQDALDPGVLPSILPLAVRAIPRLLPRFDERTMALPRGFDRGIDEPPRALSRARRWPGAASPVAIFPSRKRSSASLHEGVTAQPEGPPRAPRLLPRTARQP